MIIFFTEEINGNQALLPVEESRHCVQVLRKKAGDEIKFTDGKGNWYDAQIAVANKKRCELKILNILHVEPTHPTISIGIALTKNIQRFEWFVEKAVELGVTEIFPLICNRSERKKFKLERTQRIALSAMKQSLSCYLPSIHELHQLNDFLSVDRPGKKFIAHLADRSSHLAIMYDGSHEATCIIGPEGDFTEQELAETERAGYEFVSLGASRLRTETAGIVSLSILRMKQDLHS
jgi:16S rRNA (uracil1498-N3)-methyltransferase